MGDRPIQAVDAAVAADIPDDGARSQHADLEAMQDDLCTLVRYGATQFGDAVTVREFNTLDITTRGETVRLAFGTWNEAKREAGVIPGANRRDGEPGVALDDTYFADVDTAEKAYWLGTLFPYQVLVDARNSGDGHYVHLRRVEPEAYFVIEFLQAIGSAYSVRRIDTPASEQDGIAVTISNRTFADTLTDAGYPAPDDDTRALPDLRSGRQDLFLRGYLESMANAFHKGLRIGADSAQQAQELADMIRSTEAKQATVLDTDQRGAVVQVSHVCDVRALFEACWPADLRTTPSWEPYPTEALDYLQAEYPYPENLDYLDASGSV